jgi:hypothetical protein
MKKLIIVTLILMLTSALPANDTFSKHSLSTNLGGPGALATFEYQYQIRSREKSSFSLTAGMGNALLMFSFPLGFNYTYGDKNQVLVGAHFVPLAIYSDLFGSFLSSDQSDSWQIAYAFSPRFGYRRMINGLHGDSYFQIYFSPLFGLQGGFFPSGGIGWGVYL